MLTLPIALFISSLGCISATGCPFTKNNANHDNVAFDQQRNLHGSDILPSHHRSLSVVKSIQPKASKSITLLPPPDYNLVKADIKKLLTDSKDYWPADFGNYGPLFIRMAWHCAGNYRHSDGRGGCDGGRQRFEPERSWMDNTNLDKTYNLLWSIKQKYEDSISWGDLVVLTGNTAIESMGGPVLGFCGGRVDDIDGTDSEPLGLTPVQAEYFPCTPTDGQCTAPQLGATTLGLIYVNPEGPMNVPDPVTSVVEVREVFNRMGMNDNETVALISGGHAFGKVHEACDKGAGKSPKEDLADPWPGLCGTGSGNDTYTSGFEGQWTNNPTQWSNDYFTNLRDFSSQLQKVKSPGSRYQWELPWSTTTTETTKKKNLPSFIMMLTTDISLLHDETQSFQKSVSLYAKNQTALNIDFANAWYKLMTRDMGPITRCSNYYSTIDSNIDNQLLLPLAQEFQYPLPLPPLPATQPDWTAVRQAILNVMIVPKPITNNDKTTNNTNANTVLPGDIYYVNGQYYYHYGAMFIESSYACAITFRRTDYLGGCNGGRIRFPPESKWAINNGLNDVWSKILQPVKTQFNTSTTVLSWSDLVVFAARVAVEEASNNFLQQISITKKLFDEAKIEVPRQRAQVQKSWSH